MLQWYSVVKVEAVDRVMEGIERVASFVYLGDQLNKRGRCLHAVKGRGAIQEV